MPVRFAARAEHRVELAEAIGPDIRLGSSPECQVILHHPSVAAVHAHILSRRGRLIIRSSGHRRARISTGGTSLSAPVVVDPTSSLSIGDVEVRAWTTPHPGLNPRVLGRAIRGEIESRCRLARRYRLDAHKEALFVPNAGVTQTWRARTEGVRASPSVHLALRQTVEELDEGLLITERVMEGLRLSALLDAARRGLFVLSPSAAVVVAGHAALGLSAYHSVVGPHGNLDPKHIQVGFDGSSVLVQHGPEPISQQAYASTERRLGLPPSRASDTYAWARMAFELLTLAKAIAPARSILTPLLTEQPHPRLHDVSEAAAQLSATYFAAGYDAGAQDVGRLIRLLVGDGRPRLVESGPQTTFA